MIAALAGSASPEESATGSLCSAPVLEKPIHASAPGLFCSSEKLSLKIDETTMPWPIKQSLKIDALDAAVRHRVVVLCNGKPQQSFGFRFSDHKATDLCLFLNDLYKTAQLWEDKRCPWCRCK